MTEAPQTDVGRRCLECDYNLTAITTNRCPECGWVIDWDLVELGSEPDPVSPFQFLLVVLGLVCGIGSVAVAGIMLVGMKSLSPMARVYPIVTALVGTGHIALLVASFVISRIQLSTMRTLKTIAMTTAVAQVLLSGFFVHNIQPNAGLVGFGLLLSFAMMPGITLIVATSISLPAREERKRRLEMRIKRQPTIEHPTPKFFIEFMNTYDEGGIRVVRKNHPRKREPMVESAINATWDAIEHERAAVGQQLYNGRLARLVSWTACDNAAKLTVADTDYKSFLGTNLHNAHLHATFGDACFANAIGTSALILTRDGCIVMGRRSTKVAFHAGYLHTIGGMLEEPDRDGDTYDVFAAMRREIREELNITDDEITDVRCTGLVRDTTIIQPELIFDAAVNLTVDQIRERFNAETDEEHSALESVREDPEAVLPFIDNAGKIAPIAVAALMLHGRLTWGNTWYENTAYVVLGDLPEIRPVARVSSVAAG